MQIMVAPQSFHGDHLAKRAYECFNHVQISLVPIYKATSINLRIMMNEEIELQCDDFLAFQDFLKKMRKIDDSIVNLLNTTIPTESFADDRKPASDCKNLWEKLQHSYGQREKAITKCIALVSENVQKLQGDENDINTFKKFKKEKNKLRLLQSELNVEQVVKNRSLKVFYERCRNFYKPPYNIEV